MSHNGYFFPADLVSPDVSIQAIARDYIFKLHVFIDTECLGLP